MHHQAIGAQFPISRKKCLRLVVPASVRPPSTAHPSPPFRRPSGNAPPKSKHLPATWSACSCVWQKIASTIREFYHPCPNRTKLSAPSLGRLSAQVRGHP